MATENTLNVTNKANRVFRWAETFTETIEHFRVPVGESYAPSYTFNGYERTGHYLSETDDAGGSNPEVRLTIAETEVFRANDDYLRVLLPIYEADGTASAPAYTFKSDVDTGWFLNDTAEISGAIAGTETFRLDANGITTADGASGTPAYSFLSDTDTGMSLLSDGSIGWSTAGVERLRLSTAQLVARGDSDANILKVDFANDRVGIGTSSPSVKFHVVDSSAGTTIDLTRMQNDAAAQVGNGTQITWRANSSAGLEQLGAISHDIRNIGAGTEGARAQFNVLRDGSSRTYLEVRGDLDWLRYYNMAGQVAFRINTGEINFNESAADYNARFEGTGDPYLLVTDADTDRVGIGTQTPGCKLHVVGTGNFSTSLGVGTTSPESAFHVNIQHMLVSNNVEIRWKDSGGTQRTCIELDPSNNFYIGGSYSGDTIMVGGGAYTDRLRLTSSALVINEPGNSYDLRVEGSGNDNLLLTDAGNDRVGIKNSSPLAVLDVIGDTRIGDSTTNYATFASDGELNLVGTARVTKRRWIPANAIQSAGAQPASLTVNGNGWVIWSFADNQDQRAQYTIDIPPDMDLSADAQLCVGWSSPTTSANAILDMTYLATAQNDSTEQAGTADTGNVVTSSATADGLIVSPVVTLSGGTFSADDVCVHVILERDGNNVADTLGAAFELHGVALQYVSNKLGTAT